MLLYIWQTWDNTRRNRKKLLTKTLEQSEIKIAISELKEGKSPGIDGIPLEFYKTFWEDLKEILTELFIFILESNTIPNEAKTSAISLIPKTKEKTKLDNWRPISLLCVDFKILAKILTNRIKPVLNRIINPYQTGGLKERNITDNLCNIRNALIAANNNKGAILSLDFAKAFDYVDREKV